MSLVPRKKWSIPLTADVKHSLRHCRDLGGT